MRCRNCKNINLEKVIKIGKQPLSGFFYDSKKTILKKYSLDLFKCTKCDLVQLKNSANINKMYGKPLWLTEFAVGDWDAKTPEANKHKPYKVLQFMKEVLPRFEKIDFLEKYAWFPAGQGTAALGTSALFDKSGKLTRLGEYYRDF